MALAFPGPTNPTVQVVGRDAFLDALDDGHFRIRVLEREPQTLEAALRIASKLEAYGKSTAVGSFAASEHVTVGKAVTDSTDLLDPTIKS